MLLCLGSDNVIFGHVNRFLTYLLFFSSATCTLRTRWTKTGHMLGSECDLKMHVRKLGILSPYTWGLKTTFFRRLRKLAATLTACIFGTKHDIHNYRASTLATTRVSYIVSKCRELWSTNRRKTKQVSKFLAPNYREGWPDFSTANC